MEKIRANELRIGNFVMDRGGKVLLIDHWEYENKISEKRVDGLHPFTEFVEYLQPIALTEEWLLKFGFEKNLNSNNIIYYILAGKCLLEYNLTHNIADIVKKVHLDLFIEIKYVNQLQNLYFALTGEELEINN